MRAFLDAFVALLGRVEREGGEDAFGANAAVAGEEVGQVEEPAGEEVRGGRGGIAIFTIEFLALEFVHASGEGADVKFADECTLGFTKLKLKPNC